MIVCVDGFDMVGKSKVIENLRLEGNKVLTVDYEKLYQSVDKVSESYLVGLSWMDFYSKLESKDRKSIKLVLDRSIPSSYAYSKFYNLKRVSLGSYVNLVNSLNPDDIRFIYVKHSSKDSARVSYDHAQKDTNHQDPLDKFGSFEKYWDTYLKMDKLYSEYYKISHDAGLLASDIKETTFKEVERTGLIEIIN